MEFILWACGIVAVFVLVSVIFDKWFWNELD